MAISMDEALENCLDSLKNNNFSIEECAALYPQYQEKLLELLGLVTSLNSLDQISPRTKFVENASQRLVSKLPDRNDFYGQKTHPIKRKRKLNLRLRRGFSFLQIVILVVFILSAVTGGTAFAADFAEPGDLLYELDLRLEQVQLNLARNADAAVIIHLKIAAERLEEAQNKLNEGDIDNGTIALDAYGNEVAALEQLIESEGGEDQVVRAELVETAFSKHQEVLKALLEKVPGQARAGIERAIEASKPKNNVPMGPPENKTTGPPEDKTTGKPEDKTKGKPDDKTKGKPDKGKTPPGKP